MTTKKGSSSFLKIILLLLFLAICAGFGYFGFTKYKSVYDPNVNLSGIDKAYLFIPSGSTYNDLVDLLTTSNYLIDNSSFEWVAERKNLSNNIHPGRYLIKDNMNNDDLVNLLRSGSQVPVQVTFSTVASREIFAGKIARQIEADSSQITELLHDGAYLESVNFSLINWQALLIPNTHEFYWNTSAQGFMDRLVAEYNIYWSESRTKLADDIGLNIMEVSVLASIIQRETTMNDEKPIIAGVYLNRLKRGMRLEADPTLIYALGDFSIKRVLDVHKEIDSPYNTYIHSGLPPGPICTPTTQSLEAVLNAEAHSYLFFCAKEDFSGYHNFAITYAQHRVNARKFQRELNKRRIWK
ncbi:MAG: aminodeoxychorismate lyase [Bacteroidetes bacterium]|nr:MAG: aminodeoxychorismate lyase [Bacteroidota bacterium]